MDRITTLVNPVHYYSRAKSTTTTGIFARSNSKGDEPTYREHLALLSEVRIEERCGSYATLLKANVVY